MSEYPILDRLSSRGDLCSLSQEQLDQLAAEIRTVLVEVVTKNGGHLASNLGVVELTIAMHRVFETPKDHFIFDVSHQCYVHKILTDRRDRFETLRRPGGLSGFTKRSESVHDCFGAGHSSTSVSAALGFAMSDQLQGNEAYTVAVLGDGAFTGGMIHEALNNCRKDLKLIIVINENEMSISKNIGRFARHLTKMRSKPGYLQTKATTGRIIKKIPLIGNGLFRLIRDTKKTIKNMLYGSNYFEDLGLYYLGPVDGNDERAVENLLREAKRAKQSCVVHLKTKKGKGYLPAEENPNIYHGLPPSDSHRNEKPTFSKIFGDELCKLAAQDERICAITAAMSDGTGLEQFRQQFPDRFFDVGIAEEHAVTFAAGLAANGMRPVVAIYSTFLQRAYDQILHDVALQGLPVVFCVDRAGLNAADGATHHGIFDVAYLSQVPGLTIETPVTEAMLRRSLADALARPTPTAIRYCSGCEQDTVLERFYAEDQSTYDRPGRVDFADDEQPDALIVTDGRVVSEAMTAAELWEEQSGKRAGIILLEHIKPYEQAADFVAERLPQKPIRLILLEEDIRAGGMGMLLCDQLTRRYPERMANKTVHLLAPEDNFVVRERAESIYTTAGVSSDDILRALSE
ncbi:MAG: 1-deoxy-D-xylulose-5-phosphate synthase [Clostridia bacterium]|nr:1-deoxy-D-xylulose-5-phosphate synthase [Clostridia bacterium]